MLPTKQRSAVVMRYLLDADYSTIADAMAQAGRRHAATSTKVSNDYERSMVMSGLPDLTDAFERSGLVDVAYAVDDGQSGRCCWPAPPPGLARVAYLDTGPDSSEEISRPGPATLAAGRRAARRLDPIRRQLDEFFAGRRREFDLPLDWRLVKPGFTRAVLEATALIPFGETTSYKGVAGRAGNERAFRAAGTALGSNPVADRRALPPRAARWRRSGRLHRRARDQAHAFACGGRPRRLKLYSTA